MERKIESNRNSILHIFPEHLREQFAICATQYDRLQEIRLRAGRPVILQMQNQEFFLSRNKALQKEPTEAFVLNEQQITDILNHVCNYSLYAFEDEIRQGFLTVPGGHRIGLAGQAVLESDGQIRYLKHVHYLNIRVSHQIKGVADSVLPHLYQNGKLQNTLILSPPGCGKTTLLRDIIRQVSDGGKLAPGCSVSVIDERSEIAGSYQGIPQNDVGMRTDVMDACPKALGMMMVIRSMAPQVLAVDELGNEEECRLLGQAQACGCRILATMHGETLKEVQKKEFMERAWEKKLFQRYIVLAKKDGQIGVRSIYNERMEIC